MAWALANVRYLADVAVLLAVFGYGWHVGAGHVQRRWDADKQAQATAEAHLKAATLAKQQELQAHADDLEKQRDLARSDLDSYRLSHPVHVRLCGTPSGSGGGLPSPASHSTAGAEVSPVLQPEATDIGPALDELMAEADGVNELYRVCRAGYLAVSR